MTTCRNRLLPVLVLAAAVLAPPAAAAEFVYLLARSTTPSLRAYRLEDDASLTWIFNRFFPADSADTQTRERKVLGYAPREKMLVVGFMTSLRSFKVLKDGSLVEAPVPSIAFAGGRIDAIEVVDVAGRSLVYVADGTSNNIFGYEIAANGNLTPLLSFPFESAWGVDDMAAAGGFLYTTESANLFVYAYRIAADGTLSGLPNNGSTRPEFDMTQIEASPDGSTLYANASEMSYVQVFQRDKKSGGVMFSSLTPFRSNYTSPTLIAVGKKHLALARVENDVQPDIRILKMGSDGRLQCITDLYQGDSGMSDLRSIALVRKDKVVLAVSDVSDQLRTLAVDKKYGYTNATIDTENVTGLANLATMLVVER